MKISADSKQYERFPVPSKRLSRRSYNVVLSQVSVHPTPNAINPFLFQFFLRSPAAFGPDALQVNPPLEHRPLIKARPRDACMPLFSTIEKGAIALVERGTCNFTQKVTSVHDEGRGRKKHL